MTDGDNIKACPMCAETIKAAAKVCPHCRYWQKKWSLQNPQVGVTLWILVCSGLLACVVFFFEKILGPKEQFTTYRHEIAVLDSQFSSRISGSNLLVTVLGTLTNRSRIGWKNVGVEAQFFDKSGRLIDAITADADYRGVTILPHGDAAFKIEGKAARRESDYSTHRAFVRWAKDADTWP
jgi:hypothetical protein